MKNKVNIETQAATISEKFLLGDLIKACLAEIRQMPFAWGVLPEKDQQKIIDRLQAKISEAVRQTVQIIAADARPALHAEVESVTFKDGIKAIMQISKSCADRHELADSTGQSVLIVLPQMDKYLGGDMPVPEKDQPELTI